MDILRNSMILAVTVLVISTVSLATPLDTAWDLVWAVESRNGDWFLDLLSESLRIQLETSFSELQELAETQPGIAAEYILAAGLPVVPAELQSMTTAGFISILLDEVFLPPSGNIVSEEADLRGRNAEVLLTWMEGFTLDLQMTWEESSWKITGSSIISQLF